MPSVVQLALPNTTENPADRGECRELNADTLTRCTGRMMAEYIEATPLLLPFPVWRCSCCGRKDVK